MIFILFSFFVTALVKHGWVQKASDWQYSSFHRYVRLGWLPSDWDWGCVEESSPFSADTHYGE
jgi:hypothetical protein